MLREEVVAVPAGDATLTAVIYSQVGSREQQRRPAVVLLHGCGGMFDTRGQLMARDRW